ncbi:Antibiotic biosynthesis monooxygenase OS=Tsukamurella paurometabola (strain ATCC 8368 / DSM/ CCUG 35730 / CIP 100753 / JCM 10117 / KCTC 9821 / NBRC 16120/ NCIMB 702349 / NCTC 13040) OX=521096 GN=Tpau_3001 PE=4 SV=1 [Tsukamurella paurometabola]|uniref:Antibiotic biosynthesis monooxygenase n=1 Tax=Tsukamurella paurometabola (strain ATCC 8368 / DSM 20162 / CCUG 35730 / CIP 100753 / JCM 10117 / KCTC 9821 / NBRC 16120 / NCIMB 702349 / NCTC 13040) TaxID=521096 RepID=D5UU93_TSUPD|nr:putative quinol monooxygenase [Tsukamurella paurometabola]ADG79596.1 Antibiotic biosynthesis monooxygenase [Tsukamurella paurometabola DSM 20162]SUP36377.1 Antibiotic biosynthesis monooxygenase [Tsukamurella paurometabola]
MTVLVSAVVKPTAEGRAAVREAIATALPLVRQEPGCISYDAAENESEFFFIEQWESPEALTAHSTSPAFTAMVQAVGPHLYEPLQVRTGSSLT